MTREEIEQRMERREYRETGDPEYQKRFTGCPPALCELDH
jgi:hypothetical protein